MGVRSRTRAISRTGSGRARTPLVPGYPGVRFEGGYAAVTDYLRATRPDTAPSGQFQSFETLSGGQRRAVPGWLSI